MIAFLCRTPVQVLRAVQLHYYDEELKKEADIFIHDTFPGSSTVIDNLKKTGLFRNVYSLLEGMFIKGKFSFLRNYYSQNTYNLLLKKNKYNTVVSFNISSVDNFCAYNILKKNAGFKYYYIEDAPMIYAYQLPSHRSVKLYQLFNLQFPIFKVDKWMFSMPEKMKKTNNAPSVELPKLNRDDKSFITLVNDIYSFRPNSTLDEADIVIMEECLFVDGLIDDNCDFKLYKEIRDHYPNISFVVKLHPRTKVNRFEKDFEVLKNSYIPWEVYLLNGDYTKKVFLAAACTTLVSPKLLFGDENQCILTYNILHDKPHRADGSLYFDEAWDEAIDKLPSLYQNDARFIIAKDKEHIFEILGQWFTER